MITGIRSCIPASRLFASVVMVAKVCTRSPSADFHASQMPAKATGSPSTRATAKGVLPSGSSPLVVDRRRNQAAALRKGLLKHAGLGDGFRPGVDRLARLLQILREVWDQPPFQGVEVALAVS